MNMQQQEHRASYATSHALIVGINSYADPRFVPLGQAEKDASEVAALLSAPPYNFTVSVLLGEQATRQAILAELHRLRRTQPDDRIIVYFAGHGYTLTDLYAHETGYLAAADTIPDQDYTALEMDEVTGLIKNAHAKHIAFIFDACFSGQALGLTRAPAIAADKYLLRKAFQVLSAGAGDQTVSDFRSMTQTMIEALRSGVISRDGLATFSELGLYVQQNIAADSGQTQIPQFGHLRGSQGGDFIFYREEGVRLPPALFDALRSELPNTRRGAVADLMNLAHGSDAALVALAREQLTNIAQNDPNERVRAAAGRFFETLDAPTGYDSTQDIHLPRPSAPPAKPPQPAAAPTTKSALPPFAIPAAIGAAVLIGVVVMIVLLNNLTPSSTQGGSPTPDGTEEIAEQTSEPTQADTPTPTTEPSVEPAIAFDSGRYGALLKVEYMFATEDETNQTTLACIAMLVGANNSAMPADINSLWIDSGVPYEEPFAYDDIVMMGSNFGVALEEVTPAASSQEEAWDFLKATINAGKPIAAYINYEMIRQEDFASSEVGGAHVLVVGYASGLVTVHDPVGQEYRQWPMQLFLNAWNEFNYPAFAPVSAIKTGWLADGFDPPVGSASQRGDFLSDWPSNWFDANPYGTFGTEGYHTGADLNLSDNADQGQPIYAAASGEVSQIRESDLFGTVVVIQHDPLEDGTVVSTRYASVDQLQITEGQRVIRGQPLGVIGRYGGDGEGTHFLHFDISTTSVLIADPEYLPSSDGLDDLIQNFVDPLEFILAHRP